MEISHVINFDMPGTVDAYTHRIGRTGRALKTGDAFTFAVNEDGPMIRSIEKVLGSPIERKSLADFDYGDFVPENQFAQKQKVSSSSQGNRNVRIKPIGSPDSSRRSKVKEYTRYRAGNQQSQSRSGNRSRIS